MPGLSLILWGLLFSSIVVGYFIYGKKQSKPVIRYTGLALIFYPYFISNLLVLILLGVILLFIPKFVH